MSNRALHLDSVEQGLQRNVFGLERRNCESTRFSSFHQEKTVIGSGWCPNQRIRRPRGVSFADILGVLARGANCTNVHLARPIAGVQKACLGLHDTSFPSGSADVWVVKCHQPTRLAVEWANGPHTFDQSRGRSLRAVAVAARRWRSSTVTSLFLALSNRGALSILDATFKFAQASCLVSGEPWSTCAWNGEHSGDGQFWKRECVSGLGPSSGMNVVEREDSL